MKVEKVETIRVRLNDEFYCQITPSADYPECHDFILYRKGYGVSCHMFGCKIESDEHAVELAVSNAYDYIPVLVEECVD